jgi:hypothetical protein
MLAARTIRHCVRCSRGVSPTSVRNRAANAERDIDTLRARVGTVHPCPGWKCMSRKASPQYNLQFPMGPVGRVWRCRTRHCPHNPKGRWFKSSPRNHVKAPGNQRVLGASWFSLEGGRRPFLSRLHSSLPSSPGGGRWPCGRETSPSCRTSSSGAMILSAGLVLRVARLTGRGIGQRPLPSSGAPRSSGGTRTRVHRRDLRALPMAVRQSSVVAGP